MSGGTEAFPLIRVLVVDDHRVFSDLLSFALDSQSDFECIGVARSAAEAVSAARRLRPDMVVLDIQMPDGDGISAARQIRALLPNTPIAMVTAHRDPSWVVRAAQVGANGYIPKDGSLPEILDVLRRMRVGGMLTAQSLFSANGRAPAAAPEPVGSPLTVREREVLTCMGQGMAPQGIARVLGMSVHTCRGHVKSIHAKLGARSQLEAVMRAQRLGLIANPAAN
jgi:DNA-binding NarL/FixJ family response regulator